MSLKDCCSHGKRRRRMFRRLSASICLLVFILLVVGLVWIILQPKKPWFILQDATVYAFNLTKPNLLTSNLLVSILARNPNDKIGIYYDRFSMYVTYRNQQITLRTTISPTYQGHKDINIFSSYIYATQVPVAPYNSVSLRQDLANGTVKLIIKIDGRVRWKVGTFISRRYHLCVRCPVDIIFGTRNTGVIVGDNAYVLKYQRGPSCGVSV